MDNKEIRRLNFSYLANKRYGRATIARMLGYDDNNSINQAISGHALMGDKIARRIEAACSLPHGWMDLPYLQGWDTAGYHFLGIAPPQKNINLLLVFA